MIEFNLSDRLISVNGTFDKFIHEENVKEFIKLLEKEVMSAVMYADMEEEEFWETSLINKEEAQKRAQYYIEFMNFILNLVGDKLK